jgi:hypothetical protein
MKVINMFHFECMSRPFIIFTLSAAFFSSSLVSLSPWPITCGQEVNDKNSSSPLVSGTKARGKKKGSRASRPSVTVIVFFLLLTVLGRAVFPMKKHKTEKGDFGQQNPFHRTKRRRERADCCCGNLFVFLSLLAFLLCALKTESHKAFCESLFYGEMQL